MKRALRRRYGRAEKKWQRVEGGYETTVEGPIGPITYRVQKRADLDERQKWELDRHLGLKRRDGKRREPWVVLINGEPLWHAYGKTEAIARADSEIRKMGAAREAARRPMSGPTIGIGLVQRTNLVRGEPVEQESVVSDREDRKLLAYEQDARLAREQRT